MFSKNTCFMHQYALWADHLESSSAEKDLEVLVDDKLTTSQQCTLMAKAGSSIQDCISRSISSRLKKVVLPLCSALVSHIWSTVSSCGLLSKRKVWTYWS